MQISQRKIASFCVILEMICPQRYGETTEKAQRSEASVHIKV